MRFLDHPRIQQVFDLFEGRPAYPRSPHWPMVRRKFLLLPGNDRCAVCGYRLDLNVHHIKPYHVYPELELEVQNLITLGEACPTGNHHLLFGHLGDWKSWNLFVVEMSHRMYQLIIERPYSSPEVANGD